MREQITAASSGIITGIAVGLATIDLEWVAFFMATLASAMVVLTGIVIYLSREWPLKLAITPLFFSSILFLVYSFTITPVTAVSDICQMADSLGIMSLLTYVIWNRRKRYVKREAQKAPSKEKAAPTMKLV